MSAKKSSKTPATSKRMKRAGKADDAAKVQEVSPDAAPPSPEAPAADSAEVDNTSAKTKARARKAKEPKVKKPSALDTAVRVLEEAGQPLNCQEMIAQMAAKGYWTSPGGKTPSATLYSAILRETQTKGDAARFLKAERGKFALRTRG